MEFFLFFKQCIKSKEALSFFTLFLFLVLISGCATYPTKNMGALGDFYARDYEKASQLLEKPSQEEGKDQLLYLLDRGMALELAGKYKEGYKTLLLADKMSEVKDYTSLSTEAATFFTSDNIKQYPGEDFEKVLISAYLAIGYLLNGEYEDAIVECRRVNEKLNRYRNEAKRNYEQNPFARYLSGMIWEASGKKEDAYIDYKEAFKLAPEFDYLKYDLVRLSSQLNRGEDQKKWKTKFGEVESRSRKDENKNGEIILIYQQGRSAVKRANPEFPRLPKFFARSTITQKARLEIPTLSKTELSQTIYSVSEVAIKTLDDAYAGLVAKKLVGVGAKAVVSEQLRQKNELLGLLSWVGMNALDQADLRHWSTLPETIQVVRLMVPPGTHKVSIVGLDASGNPTGENGDFQVTVTAGHKAFLSWRSLN